MVVRHNRYNGILMSVLLVPDKKISLLCRWQVLAPASKRRLYTVADVVKTSYTRLNYVASLLVEYGEHYIWTSVFWTRVFVNIFGYMIDFSEKIYVVSSVLFIYINYDLISCYLRAIQGTKTTKLFNKGIKMMAYSLLINWDDSYSVCFVFSVFFFPDFHVFFAFAFPVFVYVPIYVYR